MSKEYRIDFKDNTFLYIDKVKDSVRIRHCKTVNSNMLDVWFLDNIKLSLCDADKLEYFINDICQDIRLENLEKAHQELKEE